MSLKLHEATAALLTVQEWIDEHADEILANDGELPPALAELIDQSHADFTKKVEAVGLYIRELSLTEEAVKAEAARLTQRARVLANSQSGLKNYLLFELRRAGQAVVKGPLCSVRIQKNSQPTIVALPAVDQLPAQFVRQLPPPPPDVDRAAILAAHKACQELPAGVVVEQHSHIRIS